MRLHSFANLAAMRKRRRGSALLESALALAVLTPLAAMAAGYAWSFYQFQSLQAVVEESARFGASASLRDGEEAWKAQVRQFAVCGSLEPCARPQVDGLEPENIRVELVRANGQRAAVRVAIQSFAVGIPGGSKAFDGTPSAQFPRLEPSPEELPQ